MQEELNTIEKMRDMSLPINSLWEHFQSTLEDSIKENIPTKLARTKDKHPWITRDVRRLIRKRDRWFKRKKKSGNCKDTQKYKELKRKTQQEIRRSYWKYIDSIVTPEPDDQNRSNNKRFWTFIKHKKSDGNNIPPLKSGGLLHQESVDKANILNRQFQEAFSEKVDITAEEFSKRCTMKGNYKPIEDLDITANGVLKLLKGLNTSKAPGPDNITPRVLKELASEIAPILTVIFNHSYQTGEVPLVWKSANICPIYKKGKKFEAVNYRPVSLTCISCKIMEHIITSHIMNHADRNRIMYPLQHGFRRGLSCETQLIEFIDDVTINLDKGKQTDCLIMDFSKAFDKVSHSLLIHKLNHYGITGRRISGLTAPFQTAGRA